MKLYNLLIFIIISTSFTACSQKMNNIDAYLVNRNDSLFIELKGKRRYLHSENTYEVKNHMYIKGNILKDGKFSAKDFFSWDGKGYEPLGDITIKKNKLILNISFDDYDDKKIVPDAWNGEYFLHRDKIDTIH